MKLSINLALLLTSTLALASSGEAPHKLDRSSLSRTHDKKDSFLSATEPMVPGGRRVPCERGRRPSAQIGAGAADRASSWLEKFRWGKTPSAHSPPAHAVGEEGGRRVPVDLIFVIPIEQLAEGDKGLDAHHPHHLHHHHGHHGGMMRPAGGRTLADRLDRAIDQLEPIEAGVLSFVFGFGFMSLFGMLFAITRRLVHRKRACRARRAAARAAAQTAPAPPAYVAALITEEKVGLLSASEEQASDLILIVNATPEKQ